MCAFDRIVVYIIWCTKRYTVRTHCTYYGQLDTRRVLLYSLEHANCIDSLSSVLMKSSFVYSVLAVVVRHRFDRFNSYTTHGAIAIIGLNKPIYMSTCIYIYKYTHQCRKWLTNGDGWWWWWWTGGALLSLRLRNVHILINLHIHHIIDRVRINITTAPTAIKLWPHQ